MAIIETLRQDIEQAISDFSANKTISPERQQDIDNIRTLLESNNPIKVKDNLTQYVTHLSRGFFTLFPFLEVNRFRNAIKQVLDSPRFNETAILKAMVGEAGIKLSNDHIVNLSSEKTILSRLEKLEGALIIQQQEMSTLQQEIRRLKNENQFLTKTISLLKEKNKQLAVENQTIQDHKQQSDMKIKDLKSKYETLLKENSMLKNQLLKYTSNGEASKSKLEKVDPIKSQDHGNNKKNKTVTEEFKFTSLLKTSQKGKENDSEDEFLTQLPEFRSLRT